MSGISSTDPYQSQAINSPTNFKKVREDFEQLKSALSSGDLTQAQQAFSLLSSDAPGLLSNSPASDGIGAVGQALQSGDLGAAQKAFETLQQAFQAHRHHRRHHGSGDGAQSASGQAGAGPTTSSLPATTGGQINLIA